MCKRCANILQQKIKIYLCQTKIHTMKAYVGMEIYLQAFLTLTLDGDEFHTLAALSQSENFVMMCCFLVDCKQGIHR